MGKRVLALSLYPAPYRQELFNLFENAFSLDVFFEHSGGDERESSWFSKGNYYLIDSDEGFNRFKEAKKHLKQYDLVLFYEFSTKKSVQLIIKCILKRIPYVINCDGVMLSPHGNPIFDIVKRFLVSHASACLASGENAKKYFLKYGAKEDRIFTHTFSTLHDGDIMKLPPNSSEKADIRKRLGLPTDKFICIAVGRFIPLKRYAELITEWRNMPKSYILLLIGSGSEEQRYRTIIKEHGINNVIIEKFHPKDELFEYYKAADVFVHPTSYDVWGLVINEAFACGLPAVASDHCIAALELIKDGENGCKVPMGDDKLMCDKVLKICADESFKAKMSGSALETIKHYTIENMAATHIKVFKELINSDN